MSTGDTAGASSSHSDEGFVPNAKQAAELVSQFATITGTDTACAQFYLQDRDWDLQVHIFYNYFIVLFSIYYLIFKRSLDAYFGAKQTGGIHVLTDGEEPQIVLNIT